MGIYWKYKVAKAVEQRVESEGLESFLESSVEEEALSFCSAVGLYMCESVLHLTTDVGELPNDIVNDISEGKIPSISDTAAYLSASLASTKVESGAIGVEEETDINKGLLDSLTDFLDSM